MTALETAIRKQVPSVPKALAALAQMERELTTARTYDAIRRVIREAGAIKVLLGHIDEVKAQAEDTILIAHQRIGEEIKKVPKATGGDRKSKLPRKVNLKSGRSSAMPSGTSRARLQKLASVSSADLKAKSKELRAAGKDATVTAVVRELTQGDKKARRAERERELGAKLSALPNKKYGVIVEDFESDFQTFSRQTGMDRHAANHYPVAEHAHTAEEIVALTKDRFQCAADNCVLFKWSTVPLLDVDIDVLRLRGFKYVSNYIWGKDRAGTGFWNRNKHEHFLIGVKGKIPCPAPGTQWESLIMAPVGEHSAKPECFLEMIEQYFPNLPKIELNRRGSARPGWDAWGNEATEQKDAAE